MGGGEHEQRTRLRVSGIRIWGWAAGVGFKNEQRISLPLSLPRGRWVYLRGQGGIKACLPACLLLSPVSCDRCRRLGVPPGPVTYTAVRRGYEYVFGCTATTSASGHHGLEQLCLARMLVLRIC